jgi:hypothetical protein
MSDAARSMPPNSQCPAIQMRQTPWRVDQLGNRSRKVFAVEATEDTAPHVSPAPAQKLENVAAGNQDAGLQRDEFGHFSVGAAAVKRSATAPLPLYHAAARYVVAHALGVQIAHATTLAAENCGNATNSIEALKRQAVAALAATDQAEAMACCMRIIALRDGGNGIDMTEAQRTRRAELLFERLGMRAATLVARHARKIRAVARALAEADHLSENDIEALIESS